MDMYHQQWVRGAVGWGTVLQTGRSWVRFPKSFRSHYGRGVGVDSASSRNEYQEYFLGGKGGQCVRLTTLPPSCAYSLEICEPQSPGALRACPGLYRDCFTFFFPHPHYMSQESIFFNPLQQLITFAFICWFWIATPNFRCQSFRPLILILPMWRKGWAPNNASKWQIGFNSAFNPYLANVEKRVSS
jgi:hypothetical protein